MNLQCIFFDGLIAWNFQLKFINSLLNCCLLFIYLSAQSSSSKINLIHFAKLSIQHLIIKFWWSFTSIHSRNLNYFDFFIFLQFFNFSIFQFFSLHNSMEFFCFFFPLLSKLLKKKLYYLFYLHFILFLLLFLCFFFIFL